jgi:serine/threonine protein kinase
MLLKNPVVFHTTFALYTGTEIIGEGGVGRIYKATDDTGSMYAIKLLTAAKPYSEKMKRFKNEVQFCSKHDHKNIIKVVDHGVLPMGSLTWQTALHKGASFTL